jgi:hypothetical protein
MIYTANRFLQEHDLDRDTLLNAIRVGPVEVSMDDGQRFVIPDPFPGDHAIMRDNFCTGA